MRVDAVDHDMLAFGVKKGMFLTVPQLKKIYQERTWPYPAGSGPKGVNHRYKKDFAKDLVSRFVANGIRRVSTRNVEKLAGQSKPFRERP